jgi:hypothetical protein
VDCRNCERAEEIIKRASKHRPSFQNGRPGKSIRYPNDIRRDLPSSCR